jgi:threonine/homoserine/homoserine lactone efflux protein
MEMNCKTIGVIFVFFLAVLFSFVTPSQKMRKTALMVVYVTDTVTLSTIYSKYPRPS